jgi:PilZ domain
MTKWFYQTQQIIKGPISTLELKDLIPSLPDARQTFVWSRGHTEWISADRWQPNQNIEADTEQTPQTSELVENTITGFRSPAPANIFAKPTEPPIENEIALSNSDSQEIEKTNVPTTPINEEKFRVQLNFVDQPPMSKDELMAFAARADDPAQIAIFDRNLKEWKEIYAFKDIVEKLGLTRRKHPRVPILAQFTGRSSQHEKFSARLVTISIGGLGITDVFDLKIGDTISGQITSPHFYSPVTIEAEATYCGNDGYVGLKFTQINDDSQSLVTDYVKRFS